MGFKEPKKGSNIGPDTSNNHRGNGPSGKYNDNPYLNKPYDKSRLPEERYESYRDTNNPSVLNMVEEKNKFFSLGRGEQRGAPTSVTTDPNYVQKFRVKPPVADIYSETEESK